MSYYVPMLVVHNNGLTFPDFTRHFLALLTEPIDTFCLAVLVR